VSAAADGSVLLWPRDGVGQPSTVAGAGAQIQTLARSRDGAWVAVAGSDGSVRVLAVDGASPPRRFTGHEGAVRAVVFSPDGSSLATAGDDGTTRIWPLAQVDAAPRVLRGHQGTIYGLHFAADGRRVVTAGDDARRGSGRSTAPRARRPEPCSSTPTRCTPPSSHRTGPGW
jgi:WD40 repeat protein